MNHKHVCLPSTVYLITVVLLSNRQFSQYIYKVFLDGFVILDGLREGNVYHFIVVNAYHDIALSFHDGVDGGCAQTAGKDTVVCRSLWLLLLQKWQN